MLCIQRHTSLKWIESFNVFWLFVFLIFWFENLILDFIILMISNPTNHLFFFLSFWFQVVFFFCRIVSKGFWKENPYTVRLVQIPTLRTSNNCCSWFCRICFSFFYKQKILKTKIISEYEYTCWTQNSTRLMRNALTSEREWIEIFIFFFFVFVL